MARDRANIRTDIWNDDDFRQLSANAQLLYLQLLTSATLTYAGVADWRPKRLAALAHNRTASDVENAAQELVNGLYIIIDEDTEEVLIRSFLKHDGLLQKPNVAKAMVTAYGQVYSLTLKGVIVHELGRLAERFPKWNAFSLPTVQDILLNRSVNPSDLVSKGSGKGSGKGSENSPPLLTTNYLLRATNNHQPAIKDRDLEPLFDWAYKHWPKKTERKKSLDKFKTIVKSKNVDELVSDIIRFGDAYAATTEKQFVPALNVWLNGERWTDELPQRDTEHVNTTPSAASAIGKPSALEQCLLGVHGKRTATNECVVCGERLETNPF